MLMQTLGGQTKSIMVFSEVAYFEANAIFAIKIKEKKLMKINKRTESFQIILNRNAFLPCYSSFEFIVRQ